MQKRLYIILFLSFIFILNLVIYYSSSDYRFFLKKLKYWNDEIIHTDTKPLTDDYIIRNEVPIETISNKENSLDYILDDTDKVFVNFLSWSLVQKSVNESMLFSITEEYPDKYLLYKWEDLDLYFFWNKSLDSMYDFFDVLSYDNPFTLKKFKIYGNKSFFINLDKSDLYVRLIMEYKNHSFGFKIKKSKYNLVKDTILNKIN